MVFGVLEIDSEIGEHFQIFSSFFIENNEIRFLIKHGNKSELKLYMYTHMWKFIYFCTLAIRWK